MNDPDKTKRRPTNDTGRPLQCPPHIKTSGVVPANLLGSEDKYRLVVESSDDSIYLVDKKCKYLFINKKHELRLGLPSEQIMGQPYGKFHSPAETRCFIEKVIEVFRTGKSVQHVHRSHRDGR
jgi:PAS domain S-box-containing protein